MTTISLARTSAAMLAGLATLGYAEIVSAQTTEPGASAPPASVAAEDPPLLEVMNVGDTAEPSDTAPPDVDEDPKKNRVSFSGGGGVGFAFVTHPSLIGDRFDGPLFEFHLDYSLSPSFTVGLEFMNFESRVSRVGLDKFEAARDAQALYPQAGATKDRPPYGVTGIPGGLPMNLSTVGPTLEFTPMDYDGIYLGATLGAALVHGIDFKAGGAAAGRVGYRLRIADPIAAAIEGGAHAQVFEDGSAFMPFAELQLRLLLPR
jgi:hypothetical protein